MSEWKKVKLDDCLELITYGFTNPMPDTLSGPWKVTAKDINNGRIVFETARHTSQEAFDNDLTDKSRPKKGDILLTKDGTLGRLAIVGDERVCINQSVALLRVNKDILSVSYLYYLLSTPLYQAKMLTDAGGAAIKHIYITRVNQLLIPCPSYDEQCLIANILSRYDSLIENYQKQIKLLEEAAQRLYKEWFVDLHFPGHENTKIVDGVPEGWEKKNFGSIVDYEIGGGWGDDTKISSDHLPAYVIRGTDMHNLETGNLQGLPLRYHQSSNFKARKLQEYDIVFEVSGGSKNEGVAKTFLILDRFLSQLDYPVICASFCKLIRLKKKENACYIYDTLKEWRISGITSQYDKRSASSIVNYRWKDFLSQQDIIIPPDDILSHYTTLSHNNHFMRSCLASQIRLLTEARDRLLPKLMSGEIAV